MNNPFRQHRGEGDFGRRHEPSPEYREATGQFATSQHGEGRSWRDDERPDRTTAQGRDPGRGMQSPDRIQPSANYGQPGAGQPGADWATPGYDVSRDPVAGAYDQQRFSQSSYGAAQSPDYRQPTGGQGYGASQAWGQQPGWGRNEAYSRGQSFGEDQTYEQALQRPGQSGEARHAYAPGSQIWENTGREAGGARSMQVGRQGQQEFEPDYLHWREQQLSNFDNDYRTWRDERRQKFSSDFDSWRSSRPRTEMSGKTEAANPIVGEVTDGHVGRTDLKKKN